MTGDATGKVAGKIEKTGDGKYTYVAKDGAEGKTYDTLEEAISDVESWGTDGPIHHVATDKNGKSTQRGGPWTPRFEKMFDDAGLDITNGPENRIMIPGHQGPHPEEYHQAVFDRLYEATEGLSGDAYREAFLEALTGIRNEAVRPGTRLNDLIRRDGI